MSYGLNFLGSLMSAEVKDFLSLTLDEDYFIGAVEQKAYKAVRTHVESYGKYPSPAVLQELEIALPPAEEPPAYYLDKMKSRYVHRSLKKAMLEATKHLQNDAPLEAAEILTQGLINTNFTVQKDKIVDFAGDGGAMVMQEFIRQSKAGDDDGIQFGWPTLDAMMAGLGGGDIISFVGRPGMGKTYMMLYGALSAWRMKSVPLFISMEMKPLPIVQRLAAMVSAIPITGLKKGFMTDPQFEKLGSGMDKTKKEDRPFYVVDGGIASTPEDIRMMARQLRPDVIFVDAAYLLQCPNKFLGRWERITENAETLKRIAEELCLPIVLSYQVNREGGKKKKGEATLEDIAYSDAIGQLSSCVLGLFQYDGVESMKMRKVSILKGRNGETGEFTINWGFDEGPDFMNFTEVPKLEEDLSYL